MHKRQVINLNTVNQNCRPLYLFNNISEFILTDFVGLSTTNLSLSKTSPYICRLHNFVDSTSVLHRCKMTV